jgi:hypothetical protein
MYFVTPYGTSRLPLGDCIIAWQLPGVGGGGCHITDSLFYFTLVHVTVS